MNYRYPFRSATQLSVDISVVLRINSWKPSNVFAIFLYKQSAKVACLFRFASVAEEAFVGAFFFPLEEDNTEAHTQQD